MLKAKS